ncbi:MAG: acyl-CoA dehydrogenase family protein [Actinomycetota bacterium]|jgi:alkylation response protein AidB-like acyl-CoA dehydrogenase|nr:acyl-CoA dehydrogenase family protein [Actinomycetota bacterium]
MDLSFNEAEQAFALEVRRWLAANLENPGEFEDLDAEIEWGRSWQARLAETRWVGIGWPREYGGRGAGPVEVAIYNAEYARAGAPQPVNRVGLNLAGPTLLAHGTDEQRARWLPAILSASELWCQLFSEPRAGSDLAALGTRAVRVGDGWLLTGQKVWNSYAQFSRWGLCLARTDPDAPRHAGLTLFAVDMTAPGVQVRPLVQITGDPEFNEVVLTDVFVPDEAVIGGVGRGWSVAATTLAHERGTAFPFKEEVVHEIYLTRLLREGLVTGALDDPAVAARLAACAVRIQVLRSHNWRTLSRLARGFEPGPESSVTKLAWTDLTQELSEAALDVIGADALVAGRWTRQWLWSKAASIAGGTSEIQRSIIGDRILGLPRVEHERR